MDTFQGRKKAVRPKIRLGEHVRITRNRLSKIPDRVMDIEVYPATLKEGAVPITRKNAGATFREFLGEHKQLFEVEPEDLKLISAENINHRWYVKYGQLYKGIPVHNATVGLDAAEDGKVHSYSSNYHPGIDLPTEPVVDLKTAVKTARNTYPEKDAPRLKKKEGSLVIYPEKTEDKVIHHLAWKLLLVGEDFDPEIEKFFFVDAIDGQIIHSYSARFPGAQVSGTVQGEVYPANPTDPISTVPMRNEYVTIEDAGQTTTNNAGQYHKNVNWLWQFFHWPFGEATFTLRGPYVRVQNSNSANYTETRSSNTISPCNLTWTAADRDHINVFYHMNLFHDWLEDELGYAWINPSDGSNRFNAQVNHNFDNAFAGDPMTFGTNPFARSSDVIYHECTHNVLCKIYGDYIGWPDANSEAYAMDEGFADYFAGSFTNDSRHGEGYSANPRNLQNDRQYPGKSTYNDEGHTGGTIIGGAAWNFRQRLVRIYGSAGARIADQLVLEAHQILSTYPRDYYFSDPHESNLLSALYRAADTDHNLLNGFPYFYDIHLAFHAHALLRAILDDGDSFDFSTNTLGSFTGGDLYYYQGKFWANNLNQKGVTDLGDIGDADLAAVNIPNAGYTRFGVNAVAGHTYLSKAQEGELGSYIAFRVTAIPADKSNVTIRYLYRYSPNWYVANLNTKEIHKLDCLWVSLMSLANKSFCQNLGEAADLIRYSGYNGCHYCLPRYDSDTHSIHTVLHNLEEDLP